MSTMYNIVLCIQFLFHSAQWGLLGAVLVVAYQSNTVMYILQFRIFLIGL